MTHQSSTRIAVFVPDATLRHAIVEQLESVWTVSEHETFSSAMAAGADALIVEGAGVLGEKKEGMPRFVFTIGGDDANLPDDCVTEHFPKPLRLGHLLARISLHFKSRQQNLDEKIFFGGCEFLPHQKQLIAPDGKVAHLTEKESSVLAYLAQATSPVPRDELLDAVWGYDGNIDTHTLETHIYRLRSLPEMQSVADWRNLILVKQGSYQINPDWTRG
ncbi:MAG: winged helix-turn-helix domain-containing protein [Alphaproteobacteria bacterium]|nr:winged helix-turn-helix domain-containing protein [Alphaproteobacteria bacterium]